MNGLVYKTVLGAYYLGQKGNRLVLSDAFGEIGSFPNENEPSFVMNKEYNASQFDLDVVKNTELFLRGQLDMQWEKDNSSLGFFHLESDQNVRGLKAILKFIAEDDYPWGENVYHVTSDGWVSYNVADFCILCWMVCEWTIESKFSPTYYAMKIGEMYTPSILYPYLEDVLKIEDFYIDPVTVKAIIE